MDTQKLDLDENITVKKRLNHVRILQLEDKNIVDELMLPQLQDLERKNINILAFTTKLQTYLDRQSNPNKFLYGYFNESQQLTSIMGLYFWNSLPFATLSYMFVRKSSQIFNAYENGLSLCLHKCFEEGELRGVTTFISLQKAKSFKHKSRTWRAEETYLTKKYYSIPQAEIKAGTMSQYGIICELMDHQTWNYDTTLWMTLLKPQYQKKINWGKD